MAIESSIVLPRSWPRRHIGKLLLGVGALCGLGYFAQHSQVLKALLQWSPALAAGFGQNILISLLAIGSGSVAGLLVGAMVLSPLGLLRWPARPGRG
jgi:polar amino acid transport system permease protein